MKHAMTVVAVLQLSASDDQVHVSGALMSKDMPSEGPLAVSASQSSASEPASSHDTSAFRCMIAGELTV